MAQRYNSFTLHAHCKHVPHLNAQGETFDWSHKPKPPGRFFGRFKCDTCTHEWASAWTWLGRGQKCRNCTDTFGWQAVAYTIPYEVDPLMRRPPGPRVHRKKPDHYYQNCEYCAELCGSPRRKPSHHACGKGRSGDVEFPRPFGRN
ncbi:hypothetical protein LOD99_14766 [Oopsacas minuta]|uniref:3CxxC-type domain-containing protein n=1 Tax=Oopsacas minuta TaxID=111878 RepID=A0AAV7KE08_9METZ|nr:hypothetical protein LOD99_14766 [Oopsacas minuta]